MDPDRSKDALMSDLSLQRTFSFLTSGGAGRRRYHAESVFLTCLLGVAFAMPMNCYALQRAAQGAPPSGVAVLTPDFFSQYNPVTALDMINRVPGFVIDVGKEARGYAASSGNVLIDGLRPAGKEALDLVLIRIGAAQVERIELIIGGAPGIDMQGRRAVVNVVRKANPTPDRVNLYVVKLDPGHGNPSLMFDFSHSSEGKSTDVMAERSTWTGPDFFNMRRSIWMPDRAHDPSPMETDLLQALQGEGARGKVEHSRPLAGGKIATRLFWNATKTWQSTLFGGPTNATNDRRRRTTLFEGSLQYTRPLGETFGLELNLNQSQNRADVADLYIDPRGRTESWLTSFSNERILSGRMTWDVSDQLSLQFAGEDTVNARSSLSRVVASVGHPSPASEIFVEERRSEYSAVANWKPRPELSAEAAIRVERSRMTTNPADEARAFIYLKPSVQLVWSPARTIKLAWRVERSVSQLDFDAFASSIAHNSRSDGRGKPDLKPQKTLTQSFNVGYGFWNAGVVSINVRHEDYKDVIDRVAVLTPDGVVDATGNIGQGKLDRLAAIVSVPLDKLRISGGLFRTDYAASWTRVIDPITHEERNMSGINPRVFSVSFTQTFPKKRFSYGFIAESSMSYEQFGAMDYVKYDYGVSTTAWLHYSTLSNITYTLRFMHATDWNTRFERQVWNDLRGGNLARQESTQGSGQPLVYFFIRKEL